MSSNTLNDMSLWILSCSNLEELELVMNLAQVRKSYLSGVDTILYESDCVLERGVLRGVAAGAIKPGAEPPREQRITAKMLQAIKAEKKVILVKELRAEYGYTLKMAKEIADSVFEVYQRTPGLFIIGAPLTDCVAPSVTITPIVEDTDDELFA